MVVDGNGWIYKPRGIGAYLVNGTATPEGAQT
ncbi:hypothetical protein EV643_13620 [Kribbella sp. VKM Ac-2527]|uniref:Uncharacterized protein n=1 Tax=Kribbella caucasensis TaxID=2512215 RepID=A0A4V3C5P2_9ACTN|nr:hypothetical protein EV643_13620 [Kribbella sp. VKM Ac-2527]